MLTERTIETFLRSVAANCTDAQYETLAKAFAEVPGLAATAAAADLQIKAGMRCRLMRDIASAKRKAFRIDKMIEGKQRAINCSESNIQHCNERISRSMDIIECKRNQIHGLLERRDGLHDAACNNAAALEEFDRKHPDVKTVVYVPRKSH